MTDYQYARIVDETYLLADGKAVAVMLRSMVETDEMDAILTRLNGPTVPFAKRASRSWPAATTRARRILDAIASSPEPCTMQDAAERASMPNANGLGSVLTSAVRAGWVHPGDIVFVGPKRNPARRYELTIAGWAARNTRLTNEQNAANHG